MNKFSILLIILFFFSACVPRLGESRSSVVTRSGISGAALGATTGVVVASLISRGDVAASALLGTAIGFPVGIVMALSYQRYLENSQIDKRNIEISNYAKYLQGNAVKNYIIMDREIDKALQLNIKLSDKTKEKNLILD